MPIVSAPQDFNEDELYVDLLSIFGESLFLKCEGFNFAGSIKVKAATEMVEAAERDGRLTPGSILVESSSGNLGVALAMIAASKGYRFLCVTDSRCNKSTRSTIEALGSKVHMIPLAAADKPGGLLGARIDYVRKLCASDDRYVWLNQYSNEGNWQAHYRRTAPAIVRQFPKLDVLFVGAGTTGTLMGCARYLKEWHRPVRIVAVDAVGYIHVRSTSALARGLDAGEVADHEEQIHQPEREPHRRDGKKPDREEHQARSQEQQDASEQPEAIASTGVLSPLGVVDPAAKRGAVVIEGRERE